MLHSHPTIIFQEHSAQLAAVADDTHQRYADIFRDVETLIRDHSNSLPFTCDDWRESERLTSTSRTRPTRDPRKIQANPPRPQRRHFLHTIIPPRCIQIPGRQTIHQLAPLRRPFVQRRPSHPQHRPTTRPYPHAPHSSRTRHLRR